ncbi:MAG: GIY-YIG nuclease family protein [Mangrovibacterium sp.]
MHFCYILYSEKLDKYYIGSTGDPTGRLQRHNSSKKGFTATGKPWTLKYLEKFETKELALKREMQLKAWKNRLFLEELIRKGSGHPD